jgi:hypothetical protein
LFVHLLTQPETWLQIGCQFDCKNLNIKGKAALPKQPSELVKWAVRLLYYCIKNKIWSLFDVLFDIKFLLSKFCYQTAIWYQITYQIDIKPKIFLVGKVDNSKINQVLAKIMDF